LVAATASEQAGVIVIRVWIERDAPKPLRARITASSDLMTDEQTIAVVAGAEEIVAAVQTWLETFARG
jgi:hypothetical protein